MPHAETGVPHGRKVDQSADARYLYRLNDSSYVGLLVRGVYYLRQGVDALCQPSDRFGVVAEVPEGDVAKIEALIAPIATPQTSKKTTIEIAGVSADELRGLLGRFRQDLETLGSTAKDELLSAGRKLEAMLSGANLKE
ncbi:MAG: hypothetical protein COX19_10685 [Desulfobacterales bacterium CG23_combo_of_CG06-09_8_20_14_all_51_8]|nr:MAG: hypothetical protein COX19_10685 [Desulfobacterales bacterium CG23_combo_of_CG06-09_8_20_14_all_51_8]